MAIATTVMACASADDEVSSLKEIAFPTAEGFGRVSLGGRGGNVVKVTTLDDAGPGSLRAAVEMEGPRIVVFDIAGTIALRSPLRIEEGRITIAGQSAPGGGITIRDYPVMIEADDVIVRYLRFRLGDEAGIEGDALSIVTGSRIMIDHVSASWSTDEVLSISHSESSDDHADDVTVQWSIISEALNQSEHEKGAHGYGTLLRTQRGAEISFHHNLWAHHLARMPRPGNWYGPEDDPVGPINDFRNNVFYNWGRKASGYNADEATLIRYNFVGNSYVPGPDTKGEVAFDEDNRLARAYFSDNTMSGDLPADPYDLVTGELGPNYRAASPFAYAGVKTDPADEAYERVLQEAGASHARDDVDDRVVDSVRTKSGRIIDDEDEVGGWPDIAASEPAPDTDDDGMTDAFERQNGLDPSDPSDAVTRTLEPGYTNVEVYLNRLVDS